MKTLFDSKHANDAVPVDGAEIIEPQPVSDSSAALVIAKLPRGVEIGHDPPPDVDEDFKWGLENWKDNGGDVVVAEQRAIAIYSNPYNQLVIRQEQSWNDDDDTWICISPEYAPAIIKKMQAVLAEIQRGSR